MTDPIRSWLEWELARINESDVTWLEIFNNPRAQPSTVILAHQRIEANRLRRHQIELELALLPKEES